MAKIAFIGLGNMGRGMAGRLLAAGHELRVYNRTAARSAPLVASGATPCATARDACAGVDAVISMVADDAASRAVWLGAQGVLEADLAPGALAIECSTLSHGWVLELADAARARSLRYLDAPVTGLPDSAAAGQLTLLVGAHAEDLRDAGPLLAAFSTKAIHFGPVGAGTVYKLMVNLLGAVQIASVAEGMALAERAGLDLKTVAEAISTGQAASPQVVRNARRMAAGDHDVDVTFTPELRLKDVDYALRLAGELGVGSPFGALAGDAFRRLCELGYSKANESKVIEVARRRTTGRG